MVLPDYFPMQLDENGYPDWMANIDDEDIIHASNQHEKQQFKTIFISDTHLGSKGAKAEYLAEFLKYNHCQTLYLVGDIIDGWRLKKRNFWPQSHTNVIRRILTLSKRGTQIIYVTGNHDEFLRRYSGLNFGNIALCDEAVFTCGSSTYLVTHGDKYDSVIQTQKWLAFIGDWGYETLVVLNRHYNKLRNRFGLGYWSLSSFVKQRVKKAVAFISTYEKAVANDCRDQGYSGVICGHIHHPEIREIEGIEYLNCGDWVESCTAIVETLDGELKLLHWVDIDHANS